MTDYRNSARHMALEMASPHAPAAIPDEPRTLVPDSLLRAAAEFVAEIEIVDALTTYRAKPDQAPVSVRSNSRDSRIPPEYADCPFEFGTDAYVTWCSARSNTKQRVRR
jgi:hypothetical protein